MSNAIQLNLWDWLEEAALAAAQMPELVTVADGVAALDSVMDAIADESIPEQLTVAAEAFVQLSAILERKSEQWLGSDGGSGLALEADWMEGLVRRSVSFDLSSLVESPLPPDVPKRQRPTSDSSLVAAVEPDKLLALVEQLAQEPEFVQAQLALLAGGEMPGQWQDAIERAWSSSASTINFVQLQQQTGLAPVELWLALLLSSNYRLVPNAEACGFYQLDFQVRRG